MSVRGICPGGYNWYVCAAPTYEGCCAVDPCSRQGGGCPPDAQHSPGNPVTTSVGDSKSQEASPPPTTARAPSTTLLAPPTTTAPPSTPESTGVVRSSLSSGLSGYTSTFAGSSSTSGITSSASAGLSSTPGNGSNDTNPAPLPLAVIVGAVIGGVLIILIIILIIILCRRHRKSKNSAVGISTHASCPELLPNDGAAKAERKGFLALFKRTRPISTAKTITVPTDSPSTTFTELPSPTSPQSSQHNSLIPGFAELASPPMSSVSELSSADRVVYSSTNVSTASTGAVVSPMPHETLRGGGRPVMSPNMTSHRREGRKHVLSWQSLESGDGY